MEPEITVYGTDTCEDTQRTRAYLDRRQIAYTYVNIEKDENAERKVVEWNRGRRITPTVVIAGNGHTVRLAEPSDAQLERILGSRDLSAA